MKLTVKKNKAVILKPIATSFISCATFRRAYLRKIIRKIIDQYTHVFTICKKQMLGFFSLSDPRWGRGIQDNNQDENQNGDKERNTDNTSKPELPPTPKKPRQQPPDLGDLWQDFSSKLNKLFDGNLGKGQKNYKGGSNSPEKAIKFSFGLISIVAASIWLATGVFVVQEGEIGMVLQFGRLKYSSNPGINWRLPWPIQKHELVNLSSLRSVEIGRTTLIKSANLKDSSMLTEDENIIDVRFAVQYRLKNAADYLFNNLDVESTVIQVAEAAVREIVGGKVMDFALYEGREKIAIDLTQLIQNLLDRYGAGVLIASVTIQNVQPPEQVQAAFDDAVRAGQDRERLKNEGQAYANDILPKARGSAARLLEEAKAYKGRLELQAEGDAARFTKLQTEYSKAPRVTRDRFYIETMQQIYTNVTKIFVDTKQGSPLLYMPLDKLINLDKSNQTKPNQENNLNQNQSYSVNSGQSQNYNLNSQSNVTQLQPTSPANLSIAPNQMDIRSREDFRNREREQR